MLYEAVKNARAIVLDFVERQAHSWLPNTDPNVPSWLVPLDMAGLDSADDQADLVFVRRAPRRRAVARMRAEASSSETLLISQLGCEGA